MRLLLKPLIIMSLIIIFINPAFAHIEKGDTLVIEQADQDITPFNDIIAGDTLTGGARIHLVYELAPNGWYPLSSTLSAVDYNLSIVGGKRTGQDTRPCVLVKGDFMDWYMISAGQNITLKGIHFMQIADTEGGDIGQWARAGVELTGTNAKVVFHDMIWDFNTGFAFSGSKDGLNLSVTRCLFRFNKPPDNSVWCGQGFDLKETELDTVIFQNCTWYGGGSFLVSAWESSQNLFLFDHCTVVDFVQFPIHGMSWDNTLFTNNLFYNAHTLGEDYHMRHTSVADTLPYGIINIDTVYFNDFYTVDWEAEAARSVQVKNNNNFVSPNIKSYWYDAMSDTAYYSFLVADPDFYDGFMNSRVRAMFANDTAWPGLVLENTTSLDPQFADYFDYSDTLIEYSRAFYIYAKPTQFMLDPDGKPLQPTDPMFYNLKITNSTLRTSSTKDGPIGDLTWELPDGYNSTQAEFVTTLKKKDLSAPKAFTLNQNYPNPFNPETKIKFSISAASKVKLTVFNTLGQEITTLVNNKLTAGQYEYTFDAGKLSSGIYIYRLQAGDLVQQKKMILIK